FPCAAVELQSYDAVVLANVPHGEGGGLSVSQERALVQYVGDLGGGLVVIGGPEALGAGHWQGSDLEKILPLNMDPPPQRIVAPAGGTSIYPALEQACDALLSLPQERARVRHILLLTDGVSAGGDYDALLAKMARAHVTLSTIAVGNDADRDLLSRLARQGG